MITLFGTAAPPQLGDQLLEVFGRMHPLLVHFPVALLLVAAVLELVRAVRPGEAGRRAVNICLHLGALGAVAAAASGWVFQDFKQSTDAYVEVHRWTGVALAGVAVVTSVLAIVGLRKDAGPIVVLQRLGLLACAVLVAVTGHFGAEMSWGEGWLTEPLQRKAKPARDADEGTPSGGVDEAEQHEGSSEDASSAKALDATPVVLATVYEARVAPLLEAKCFECHGPTGKAKGELRLHDLAEANDAYFNLDFDALIVPGDPDTSALVHFVELPRTDDDVMPPDEEEPLAPEEIALLRAWVAAAKDFPALFTLTEDALAAAPGDDGATQTAAAAPEDPGASRVVVTNIGVVEAPIVPAIGAAPPKKEEPAPTPEVSVDLPPGPTPAPAPALDVAAAREASLAVFAARCFDCHGPDVAKPKAKLRVHDPANFVRDDDRLVVPGDALASELYEVLARSADEKGHMPPKGERLTAEQLAAVRAWIDGSKDDADFVGGSAGDDAVAAPQVEEEGHEPAARDAVPLDTDPYPGLPALEDAAFAAVAELGGEARRVAANTNAVEAVFRYREGTVGDDLASLEPLASSLVSLDLGRTSVGDDAGAWIARCTELRRLHLERTAVTDAVVTQIASLPHLEYLNLTETAVGDGAVDALAKLPEGCRVYLFGSAVTDAGRERLAGLRSDLVTP
ncbi:MAG: c-type cytochrome domain-containing protein [Planctomycetota bacterium]